MSFLVIDTSGAQSSLYFSQLTQLDSIQYRMNFYWSTREAAWYLSIYDQNENPLAVGLKLNVSWNLLRRFKDPRLPQGLLYCLDTSEMNTDISDPTELGGRVPLMYATPDEIAGLNLL